MILKIMTALPGNTSPGSLAASYFNFAEATEQG